MVRVAEDAFGSCVNPMTNKTQNVRRFTITNKNDMSLQVITYGATLTTLKVPDANGKLDDILLGYDDIAGYLTPTNPYMGCTVGRVCSRVGNGRFMLNGKEIQVTKNFLGKHQLHGGLVGFSKVFWEVINVRPDGVVLQFRSPDGHEGYPGEVVATATYTLTEDNCMRFCLEATTNKATPVNMTNHAYFNLAGHASGKQGMSEHMVTIKSNELTDMDEETVPNGEFVKLEGHVLDLRKLTNVGEGLKKIENIAKGYDHNYVLEYKKNSIVSQAKAYHPASGRTMEISSNMPCMHFYTSHNMPDISKGEPATIIGKGGAKYEKYGGFCMETHWYPNAVNHPTYPSVILNPGQKYNHICVFKFGIMTNNKNNCTKVC